MHQSIFLFLRPFCFPSGPRSKRVEQKQNRSGFLWKTLEKYQRFWVDVDQRLLFGSGLCQSLRHLSQEWSATLESSVGLRTLNERIHQIEPLLEQAHSAKVTDVSAVVQFDGIWLREQTQTKTIKLDKRGRKRHQRSDRESSGARCVGLVDGWQW
jgi:hypothetical protein